MSTRANEKRRMAIMAALGHQLSHEPAEMDWNLKHLRLMRQVAEQSHFHNVEHHPDAVGTLEDIRANKKARQLAGWVSLLTWGACTG